MILKERLQLYLPPLLFTCLLVSFCMLRVLKTSLLIDEIITTCLLTDRSFPHMIHAIGDQLEQCPPLYFILGWIWEKIFGPTVLSLRLFSCLGISVACSMFYITLYKIYKFWPALLATFFIFLGSDLVLDQGSNIRPYALYLAICSLGMYLYYEACRKERPSMTLLWLLGLFSGALVLTHLYGFVYCALLLTALMARDRYFKLFRPKIYVSILAGCLLFLPWLSTEMHQMSLLKEGFWVPKPDISGIGMLFLRLVDINYLLVIVMASVLALLVFNTGNKKGGMVDINVNPSFLFLAVSFLFAPLLSWLASHTGPSSFVVRYLLPSVLSLGCLFAVLCAKMSNFLKASDRKVNLFFTVVLGVFIWLFAAKMLTLALQPKYVPGLKVSLPYADLPVVGMKGGDMLPYFYYAQDKSKYIYIQDRDFFPQNNKVNHHGFDFRFNSYIMEALDRNYLHGFTQKADDFLKTHRRFLLLNDKEWFYSRFKDNPIYQYKFLEDKDWDSSLILVWKAEK